MPKDCGNQFVHCAVSSSDLSLSEDALSITEVFRLFFVSMVVNPDRWSGIMLLKVSWDAIWMYVSMLSQLALVLSGVWGVGSQEEHFQ